MKSPVCPYCGTTAQLRDSTVIYGRSYGMAWVCANYPSCDSYVGCHKGTEEPLGRLANKELREAKVAAHAAFDPLWKGKTRGARTKAYHKLATKLGVKREECHIGMFDIEQCRKVVEICQHKTVKGKA